MSHIEHQVHTAASVDGVFDAFARYREFPTVLMSVDLVRRDDHDPELLYWHLSVATIPRIIATRVKVDRAAQCVEWRGEEGMAINGSVTLRDVDSGGTDLQLIVDFEPEGFLESVGDELGMISHWLEVDLARFVTYVESAGEQAPGTNAVTEALGKGGTPSNQLTERITSED